MTDQHSNLQTLSPRDAGCLPAWREDDLPEPRPFSLRGALRTIGPGAILLAGAIGGGEWIVGPMVTVEYGKGILWIATVAVILQSFFNLEACRYTLYTGEPILTGIMRLRPGPRVWGPFYIVLAVAQLGVPALAVGCANVIFASLARRLPGDADTMHLMLISGTLILTTAGILVSGRSIERVLERISWVMIALIFSFLIIVNVLFVPLDAWLATAAGFVTPRALPADIDLVLLGTFAATAGSGGIGNIAVSNWYRDKGFGMGARVGGIGGILSSHGQELEATGCVFPVNDANISRWKTWWAYAVADQAALWAIGCVVGMFLNVNLAAAIVPDGTDLTGYAAGAFQARWMADQLWSGFWVLALLNGFWILFSTHLGNTDVLVRTITDTIWASSERARTTRVTRIYAFILMALVAWGLIAMNWGTALTLFKVLGAFASPIMAIASVQILRINTRFLPPEVRPTLWRRIGLLACGVTYAGVAVALIVDTISKTFQAAP